MFQQEPLTVLVTIPTADRDFEVHVRSAFEVGATPELLQALLRERYPEAVVHSRVLSDELFTVWYVYRDGGWRPSRQEEAQR